MDQLNSTLDRFPAESILNFTIRNRVILIKQILIKPTYACLLEGITTLETNMTILKFILSNAQGANQNEAIFLSLYEVKKGKTKKGREVERLPEFYLQLSCTSDGLSDAPAAISSLILILLVNSIDFSLLPQIIKDGLSSFKWEEKAIEWDAGDL